MNITQLVDSGAATDNTNDLVGLTSTVDVEPVNDEPTLTITGDDPTFNEGSPAVGLFSSASVSTIEAGQTITGLTLTITNVTDTGNEQLTIDGATITLDHGQTGATTNFTYNVTVAANTATVVLSAGTVSEATVEAALNVATYWNDSDDPNNADRTVTITQIIDSGGTTNGGDDTNDPAGLTSTVAVNPTNDAPTTSASNVSTLEDVSYTFAAADFNFADADAGDGLASIEITGLESAGSLELDSVDVTLNQVITRADIDAGKLEFVPVADATGIGYDSFNFTVNDGSTDSTSSATVTIDVNPDGNDAPTASNQTVITLEDTDYTFSAGDFNFSDVDGDLLVSVRITSLESVGALQLNGAAVAINQVISKVDIDAGNLKFIPVGNGNGAAYDSFDFKVNDGFIDSVSAFFHDNCCHRGRRQSYGIGQHRCDQRRYDQGATLAGIKVTSLESAGALQLNGVDVTLNQVITKADIDAGLLKFIPVPDANGIGYDSFDFTVNDGTIDSTSAATLTLDVTPVNDAPAALDNTVTGTEDTAFTFQSADFPTTDADVDPPVSITITSLEAVGTLEFNGAAVTINQVITVADLDAGKLKFIPDADSYGPGYDTFNFTASDGIDDSNEATLTIDVTAANDAPTTIDNTLVMAEDTTRIFTAADFNFSDVDPDSLFSIQITVLETAGTLQLGGVDVSLNQVVSRVDIDAGQLRFTPQANANGAAYDSFTFTVNDAALDSTASATMTLDVSTVNDAPTGGNTTVTTAEDTTYTYSAGDFTFADVDTGDALSSIEVTTLQSAGSLQLNGVDVIVDQVISKADIDAGKLKFVPAPDGNGLAYDSFQYTVNDGLTKPTRSRHRPRQLTSAPSTMHQPPLITRC